MSIFFEQKSKTFHLTNGKISYIMKILPNGQLGQLYFGKAVPHRAEFDYLLEMKARSNAATPFADMREFSMEHVKQEYPTYGTGDFRHPAVQLEQQNGSRISDFVYQSHFTSAGKPKLKGLPATYCEAEDEAETLTITLQDSLTGGKIELLYTIFTTCSALARSARICNEGEEVQFVTTAMSLSLDLPDSQYDWVQLSGAWARERHIYTRRLLPGIQSVESTRGSSSHNQNPFVVLKRPSTDEMRGEAIGFSLIYSGSFLAQAEVDAWGVTRMTMGINPFGFRWKLNAGDVFQTPEAVMVYSDSGLNEMSQTFHRLYQKRLARGFWRDRPRPILLNNWEATYFDFDEEKVLEIARKAKSQGIELFVLDDGWFGKRTSDNAGLGDWFANRDRLPDGIVGLADKIEALGMKFGLWFEPEMINMDSDLFRAHPDWAIQVPRRRMTYSRNQYVLDFSRIEVVENIFDQMSKLLYNAKISYIKWDMNRNITEAFSAALPADQQGEIMHRYILGVYDLYERLVTAFPQILFESCSAGGGRFDPGLLYYAPQGWASDDSDAIERLKIQYGTSMCYPVSSIGAHISTVPNHQVARVTPIETRFNVACFGTFGYELDLNRLSTEEQAKVREQIAFMKKYREVLQFGTFYRLLSPFEGNYTAWMSVSEDKKTAIVGWYKVLNEPNAAYHRVALRGLDPQKWYRMDAGDLYSGTELMNIGLITSDSSSGECRPGERTSCDFDSRLFVLKAE